MARQNCATDAAGVSGEGPLYWTKALFPARGLPSSSVCARAARLVAAAAPRGGRAALLRAFDARSPAGTAARVCPRCGHEARRCRGWRLIRFPGIGRMAPTGVLPPRRSVRVPASRGGRAPDAGWRLPRRHLAEQRGAGNRPCPIRRTRLPRSPVTIAKGCGGLRDLGTGQEVAVRI
jgi:hypothetical protein